MRPDLLDLFADDGALGARLEVLGDLLLLADGKAVTGRLTEARHRPLAFLGCARLRNVGLQPGLPEALTGAVAERGDAVRAHAEQRGDLVRVHPLHLGVPEDGLPAVGKRAERSRGQSAVEGDGGGVVNRRRVFEILDVIHLYVTRGRAPAGSQVANGRIEVWPECAGRAAARQNTLIDTRIRLGDEVVGIYRRRELAGDARPRAIVTAPQLGKRALVPRPRVRYECFV